MHSWPFFVKALLSFGAGALMVLALPPWNLWPFLFIGFSLFYILLSSLNTKRTVFACSWLFGFGYFVFGLSWIANALLVEGNPFLWVWPFAIVGLPALLAFFPALACLSALRYSSLKTIAGFLAFTAALSFSEWLRGHIFTGFPWNLYGYSWTDTLPMIQITAIGGSYFLTLLSIFWGGSLGFLAVWNVPKRKKLFFLCIIITTLSANYLYGSWRLSQNPVAYRDNLSVHLVQPNIEQKDKWDPRKREGNLSTLLQLSQKTEETAGPTVIIWPETALSYHTLSHRDSMAAIQSTLSSYNNTAYLMTGALQRRTGTDGETEYANSLMTFDQDMTISNSYDKSHLVPFGEYIPLQKWLPLKPIVQFNGFTQGNGPQTIEKESIGPYTPLICYEILFPGHIIDRHAVRPEWIVNVTNDAWYGDSAGPYQHFAMTKFRAIEEGIPIVRSANTGISGIFDSLGRITYKTTLFERSGKRLPLPKTLLSQTLYAQLSDLIFFIFLTGITLGSLFLQRRQKNKT